MSHYQKSIRYFHAAAQEMRKAIDLLPALKASNKAKAAVCDAVCEDLSFHVSLEGLVGLLDGDQQRAN